MRFPRRIGCRPKRSGRRRRFPVSRTSRPALGLATFDMCGGAIADDFDSDGYLDIVVSTWGTRGQIRFFRNNRDGTFTERTAEAGLLGLYGGINLVQADYDNDGDVDLLVLRGAWLRADGRHPNSLVRNNGDGTFTDVTFDAGLGEVHYPSPTAAWGDYDNDGDLDLYVGNESTPALVAPSQLFRNNGDGTFTDVAEAAAVRNFRYAKAAVWGDYNGDWPAGSLRVELPREQPALPEHRPRVLRRRGATARRGGPDGEFPGLVLGFRQRRAARPVCLGLHRGHRASRGQRARPARRHGNVAPLPRRRGWALQGSLRRLRPGGADRGDGRQLRGPGQRWLSGLLPRHRLSAVPQRDAEPDVPEPRGARLLQRDLFGGLRPSAEGPRRGVRRPRQRRGSGRLRADGRGVPRRRVRQRAVREPRLRQSLDRHPARRGPFQPLGHRRPHPGRRRRRGGRRPALESTAM